MVKEGACDDELGWSQPIKSDKSKSLKSKSRQILNFKTQIPVSEPKLQLNNL